MSEKTLVAGIGNIFYGDDAFGVEVIRRLEKCRLPVHVDVADFGIRGVDLAFSLTSGAYDKVVLVDTVKRGGAPGTLYLITPKIDTDGEDRGLLGETHGLDPFTVLKWAAAMGARFKSLKLVGCEPGELGSEEDMKMGLSAPVRAAVEAAAKLVLEAVDDARAECDS